MKKASPAILTGVAIALMSGFFHNSAGSAELPKLPAADFYVAVNGDDAWSGKQAAPVPGKADGPFRTLERARDAVRKLKADSTRTTSGITVLVRGGVYTMTRPFALEAQDSGTPSAPVVYRSYPGENAILAGGPTLPAEAFNKVTDPKVLDRLDPAARGQVVVADLRARGINQLGQFPPKFQGVPAVPELFFNDKRMTLARWPNDGWTTIAKIIDSGSDYTGTNGGVFEYSGDRPLRWNAEAGVWLNGYWAFDWNDEVLQVKSIDREKRQIALAKQAIYSVKQGNKPPRRYYALNLLEELDSPGEYFIDRAAGLLYFWPPASLAGARVVLSTLQGQVISTKDACDVVIRGFTIEASLGHGITVNGGHGVRIQACEVRNVREFGIRVSGGTSNKVEACDIHDTGTGGITLAGGDRKTLTPAGHEAVNNHVWRFSCHKATYSNALGLEGVGNRAAHNLVHDAPHQAIGISGNDHIIEYNIIHRVCMATDDCGAFYKGRNPSSRGNTIRYNFWHNIGNPMGHGNAAVYFDDGDGGEKVLGNVFFRCGEPGAGSFGSVFSHGGHDNVAENNIFIECKRALGSSPWKDDLWRSRVLGSGKEGWDWDNKLLKEVDITKPPYTTRYPELIGFMDPQPGQPRNNKASRNVFVMCAMVSNGNWLVASNDNWSTDSDPGFVDAAGGDFRLKPNSAVFSRLPWFQPIPFDKIGLYADDLRPNLPRERWNTGPERR